MAPGRGGEASIGGKRDVAQVSACRVNHRERLGVRDLERVIGVPRDRFIAPA